MFKIQSSSINTIALAKVVKSTHVHSQSNIFSINDYGAISDGKTDNKQVFLNTWKKACLTNGGMLLIPPGTYLVSGAEFEGPCNGQTNVALNGILKASFDPTLDSITFDHVTNVQIQNINSINSKAFHMNIYESQHVTLNNVGISAPNNSPNTDGIHIAHSNDVRINNAHISTGDDCISIGDGSTNINISGVSCGPGHGLSIGSLGRYQQEKDVSSITISNCTLTNTTNGLRIKTIAPSPPSNAYNITFQHIIMNDVKNPIIIDQHYCPNGNCVQKEESNVLIKGVKFIDVRGSSSTTVAVKIDCSRNKLCQDIELSGLNLTFKGQPTTASCSNAYEKFLGSNQIPSKCS
ncbi:hypothetical protein DH2020_009554 [Rehmannia glutinosa]|uniref:Uncharacterized protein n=1 Tax=Rehmannia glutinosa TaxID=99300 RepID=A0ABR0X7X5_REHGL